MHFLCESKLYALHIKNNKHLTANHTRIISISKRKICVDEDEEVRSERNSILEYMSIWIFKTLGVDRVQREKGR